MLSERCATRVAQLCAWFLTLLLLGSPPALPQQRLETPQETNERIRQLASALEVRQGDYVIGSSDLVRIDVFDVPELSREARVGQSGYISLPLIPVKIRAQGLTAFQLEEKLAELLQTYGLVSRPQVSVFVKEQRSQPITVIGAVRRPLVYQAVRQVTLLEILSEAGGISDDAGSVVMVSREGTRMKEETPAKEETGTMREETGTTKQETGTSEDSEGSESIPPMITIKLTDLLESGNRSFNIPLLPGDVVTVPRAGVVYVIGAVQKAGGFVLQNDHDDVTALRILALAGGFKGTARPSRSVVLRRDPDTGKRVEVAVDLKKVMERKTEDVRLYPSDILFVPDSSGLKALRRTGQIGLGIVTGMALYRLAY